MHQQQKEHNNLETISQGQETKNHLTILCTTVNSFSTLHIDRVKQNMPPITLTTSWRDSDLVLQPATYRICKDPHLYFSQVKKNITISLISVSFYQETVVAMEARFCLLKRSIILAPPKISEGISTSTSAPSQAQLLGAGACRLSVKGSTSFRGCANKETSIFLNISTSQQIVFQQSSKQQQNDSCRLCCEKALQGKNFALVSSMLEV